MDFIKKILARKFLTTIIVIILVVGGYYGYKAIFVKQAMTRYIAATVEKGTLVVSVTGSGQTSALNQVDIKPKVSGDIIFVGAKNGQEVKTGTLLAQIDSTDAQKAVRDANTNLQSAQLALEKLKQPADDLSILQAENSIAAAQDAKKTAQDDLVKAYDDGFNTVSNAFIDLPGVMTGLQSILYDYTLDPSMDNITWYLNQTDSRSSERDTAIQYKNQVNAAYKYALATYTKNFDDYKATSRTSDSQTIETLIAETYETTKVMSDTIKATGNYIDFVKNSLDTRHLSVPVAVTTQQTTLDTYTSETNTHLLNLRNIQNTIQNSRDTIVSSDRTIAEKTDSLAKLKAGADPLDIKSQELSIQQKQNALLDAQQKLADYFIRAPFDGIIAKMDVTKGDPSTASTVIATLITKQRIAEISLNEVDVSKIKVGDKVTLTFDAIDGLSITGEVAEIDSIGAVTQGVVTYGVKIGFDTQDPRVKPGMSVSAAIITDTKQDVLVVPNAAVKQNSTSYVEIFLGDTVAPRQRIVQTGLSNDTMTEIVSGLSEGDKVVTQTIVPSTATSQTQSNTGLRIPGITGGAGGGGGFRGGAALGR